MANFCSHCGSPMQPGAAFCPACGARSDASVQPAQQPAPPVQQPVEPVQQPAPPVQQPVQPAYAPVYQQPPVKKSHTGLIVTLSIVIPLSVLLIVGIILIATYTPNIPPIDPPSNITSFVSEPDEPAEPDLPDVEKYGIAVNVVEGKEFSYTTAANDDSGLTATGKLKLDDYTRAAIGDEILVFGEDNDMDLRGYDIIKVSVMGMFSDEVSQQHGVHIGIGGTDYYDMQLAADSSGNFVDTYDATCNYYQVRVNGEEKTVYFWNDSEFKKVGGSTSYQTTLTFLVPGGYDGAMVYFRDYSVEGGRDFIQHHDPDELHLFRFD